MRPAVAVSASRADRTIGVMAAPWTVECVTGGGSGASRREGVLPARVAYQTGRDGSFLIANPGRSCTRWLPAGISGGFAPLEDASAMPPGRAPKAIAVRGLAPCRLGQGVQPK